MAQDPNVSPSDARKARFRQGLIDLKRRKGFKEIGAPDDPCVEIICKKDDRFKVQGEPDTWRPREIACLSEHGSRPVVNGQTLQISHVCGRTLCVVVAHYTFDPASTNLDRWTKCHSKIVLYLNQHHMWGAYQGKQITVADLKDSSLVCPHNPTCFYSVGKVPKH